MSSKLKDTPAKAVAGKKISMWHMTWRRLKKQRIAMVALGVLIMLAFLAIFADVLFDYDTLCVEQHMTERYLGPSLEHFLGTDVYGRDLAARIVHGIRSALFMGIVASAITIVIATVLATVASFYGGIVDDVIMRIMEILNCIPALIISIAICAGLGGGMWQLVVALSVSGLAATTRMIRSKGLSVANTGFIESSTALGASTPRLLVKSMLPNIADMVIITATGRMANNIMMGATLSFIGLGVKAPTPEWGLMLNESLDKMTTHPEQVVIPGIAILITTIAISTFGDYLRDAFDPRASVQGPKKKGGK